MKYSIIIPVYNSEAFFMDTLVSLSNQTFKDFEIIIVNDGSTDKTEEVVETFTKEHKDIKVKYFKQNNAGPATARNLGLKHAQGQFICFLDSDDRYDDHLLDELNDYIDEKTDVVYFGWVDIDDKGNKLFSYNEEFKYIDNLSGKEAIKKKYLREIWLCNCSEVYRLEMIKNNDVSFVDGVFSGEDANFIYKALLNARKVRVLPKEYFYCTYRQESLMHHEFSNKHLTEFKAIEDLLEYTKNKEDEEMYKYFYSLYFYTRITVAKKMVRSLPWYKPLTFRKMVKNSIPKISKIEGMILNKKKKFECSLFKVSKVLFFYFAKLYYLFKKE